MSPLSENSGNGSICPTCEDDGMYMRDNSAYFCSCAIGQRRKRNWIAGQETAKLKAKQQQDKRDRKVNLIMADYKTAATGEREREPGEEE